MAAICRRYFVTYVSGHYDDVIMTMLASQITSLTVVYSIVYSGVNQRKHQSSASLVFVREIHRGPVNFPHKWPVTRKMLPFDDVIMWCLGSCAIYDIHPKLMLNLNIAKSLRNFSNCRAKCAKFEMIGLLKRILWANEISRDLTRWHCIAPTPPLSLCYIRLFGRESDQNFKSLRYHISWEKYIWNDT